jgi:2-isopropylmalate synthase
MSQGSDSAPKAPGLARARRGGRALDASSTRDEVQVALQRVGYTELSELDAERAWEAFRELADAKQNVTIPDLQALVDDRLRAVAEQYQLLRMETRTRTGERAWARVEVLERGVEIPIESEGTGDGPIDASLNALLNALQVDASLVAFSVEALSTGTDALAEAHVTVEVNGRHHNAEGVAPSVTEAGVRAFLHALSTARRAERSSSS